MTPIGSTKCPYFSACEISAAMLYKVIAPSRKVHSMLGKLNLHYEDAYAVCSCWSLLPHLSFLVLSTHI